MDKIDEMLAAKPFWMEEGYQPPPPPEEISTFGDFSSLITGLYFLETCPNFVRRPPLYKTCRGIRYYQCMGKCFLYAVSEKIKDLYCNDCFKKIILGYYNCDSYTINKILKYCFA